MANNNILSSSEIATITVLQCIKIDLLLEKTRIQRDGAALEEPLIDDEPQESDYIPEERQIEGVKTFDQLLEEQLEEPTPVEVLISEAEKLEPNAQKNATSEDKSSKSEKTAKKAEKRPARWRAKFNAWLVARAAWRVKKHELEFEYDRTKADVASKCKTLDFAIGLIDREIERQSTGKAIKVDDGNNNQLL